MKVFCSLYIRVFVLTLLLSPLSHGDLPWKKQMVADKSPESVKGLQVNEHLGENVALDVDLINEDNQKIKLKDLISTKPVFLVMVYYSCPGLCNYHLNGLVQMFKQSEWAPGSEFDFIVVSFESKDDSTMANTKKKYYMDMYGVEKLNSKDWHFLTSDSENAKKLADSLGFNYRWNEETNQWIHPAVSYVLTPNGKISRYIYGISPDAQTVRLSLVEASDGKIGTVLDRFMLYCFNYNPKDGKYSLLALNTLKLGAGLTIFMLGIFLIPFWFKKEKPKF